MVNPSTWFRIKLSTELTLLPKTWAVSSTVYVRSDEVGFMYISAPYLTGPFA